MHHISSNYVLINSPTYIRLNSNITQTVTTPLKFSSIEYIHAGKTSNGPITKKYLKTYLKTYIKKTQYY